MTDDELQRLLRELVPQLRAAVRRFLVEHPGACPAAAAFDAETALRTGLVTADELRDGPVAGALMVRVLPRDQLVERCRDLPQIVEWIAAARPDPTDFALVIRTPGESSVHQITIAETAPDARAADADWQAMQEQEQSYSLMRKQGPNLAALARRHLASHPDARLAGIVLAPEVARNMCARDARGATVPLSAEPTGELAQLVTRESAEAMVRGQAPDQLDRLRDMAAEHDTRLPIVIVTQRGMQFAMQSLDGA